MSKMLDKVSKILAQAENAGTPEEAETFMAKAQELAAINGIELAVARMHQAKKERVQEPEERRIQTNPVTRKRNRKHFVDLALAIAGVNDCKSLIGGGEQAIFAMGFPSDLDVIEALFTHLSIQMVMECDEALKRGANKSVQKVLKTEKVELAEDERDWGGYDRKTNRYYDEQDDEVDAGGDVYDGWRYRKAFQPPKFKLVPILDENGDEIWEDKEVSAVDGRIFRQEFYLSFVQRMEGRLWEIKRSAEREAGALVESSSTALALRDKKKEIADADEERRKKYRRLGSYGGADSQDRKTDYTGSGSRAGREAAERVPVNEGRAVKDS